MRGTGITYVSKRSDDADRIADEFFVLFNEWKRTLKGRFEDVEEGYFVWSMVCILISRRIYRSNARAMNRVISKGVFDEQLKQSNDNR